MSLLDSVWMQKSILRICAISHTFFKLLNLPFYAMLLLDLYVHMYLIQKNEHEFCFRIYTMWDNSLFLLQSYNTQKQKSLKAFFCLLDMKWRGEIHIIISSLFLRVFSCIFFIIFMYAYFFKYKNNNNMSEKKGNCNVTLRKIIRRNGRRVQDMPVNEDMEEAWESF